MWSASVHRQDLNAKQPHYQRKHSKEFYNIAEVLQQTDARKGGAGPYWLE